MDLKVSESARCNLPRRIKELPHSHIEVNTGSKLSLLSLSPIMHEIYDLNCKVSDEEGLLEAINRNLDCLRKNPKYDVPFCF